VESPEIWEWEEQGDSLRQLTQTGGKVFDYDVSTSGDNILFSVFNAQEGIDLWLFSRADGSMEQLLDCGRDWCSSPAWSPWDDKIAYARRIAGKEGAPPDTPRVYVLEMASRIDRILYGSENVAGYAPEWSPDGRYLAFFDTRAGGIRIFDLETGKASILQTQSGLMGAWSPDSGQLAFTNFQQGVSGRPYSAVYFFAPQTQTLERFSPAEGSQLDYSVPAWSPDGNWLALALQPSGSSPSKQIWLMRPDASDAEAVTSDEGFTHAGYQFSPDGESLVFQRISLSASRARPELLRWERGSGQVYTISEDAALPSWLP
jgi:TolB protein